MMPKAKSNGTYQPTRSIRFYPGRVSEERQKQLDNFKVDIEDLTVDDIVNVIARRDVRTEYLLIDIIRKRWGEEAAKEVSIEYGAVERRYCYTRFMKTHGLPLPDGRKVGTPELQAKYQDLVHAYYGPWGIPAYCDWGDGWCRCLRTACRNHDMRPEGMESLCRYVGGAGIPKQQDIDPALTHSEKVKCLSRGDDHCDRTWYYDMKLVKEAEEFAKTNGKKKTK